MGNLPYQSERVLYHGNVYTYSNILLTIASINDWHIYIGCQCIKGELLHTLGVFVACERLVDRVVSIVLILNMFHKRVVFQMSPCYNIIPVPIETFSQFVGDRA